MNKTSSKEASTLSCLQKSLCVPSHRFFQFLLPRTFYNPVFLPFFKVSSISFPLISHTNQMCSIHLAILTLDRNDLMGGPPKASKTPRKSWASCQKPFFGATQSPRINSKVVQPGDASTGKTCKVNQIRNLPLILLDSKSQMFAQFQKKQSF